MKKTKEEMAALLRIEDFPLSAKYDPEWVFANEMGPNALWLTEMLTKRMELKPGMRVLDMGCGRAMSSIFLAKEFGVQVWANDLWIAASDNCRRIKAAGVEDKVFPIHAEARSLPYAEEFFDAILSMDSYHYYGTDDLYLNYFIKFLKRGGQIGTLDPGLMEDFAGPVPDHLRPFWEPDCNCFHTAEWWRRHWERAGSVDIEVAEAYPNGWKVWERWYEASWKCGHVTEHGPDPRKDFEAVRADQGRYIAFVRLIARRKA